MAPLIVFPFILFGGLVSNNKAQLAWLSWIQYISPIKYCAEALLSNEFANDPNNMSQDLN
jgi:ABC-type multidrug transport system permease subunit